MAPSTIVRSSKKRPASNNSAKASSSKRRAIPISAASSTRRFGTAASASSSKNNNAIGISTTDKLRIDFIQLLTQTKYQQNGITNSQLKAAFPGDKYTHLAPIINTLTKEARLIMSKIDSELHYKLVNEETASKFAGMDVQARMVYQIIQESGNKGIWTKDIHFRSKIQQQALTKIFKKLEQRKLIKPVKAVKANTKKCYMLYDLQPSKEVTGGPWYTEMEFDHEFISELRNFIMHCLRRKNGGKGVTLKEIADLMKVANVSKVQLNLQEVQQLIQTLAFDYMIEQNGVNQNDEAMFIASKRLTVPCNFKWWDVLCNDFHFRNIRFEDDVELTAHEPHHHTAS